MIEAKTFVEELIKNNLEPFIEVPCTILSPIINFIMDKDIPLETPANEAVAMGLAAGHYMATGKIPVVMMQNSGLCNSLNALTSLHGVYDLPALLIVTWRGEPMTKDAPEHQIVGAKLENFLHTFDLPYKIITEENYSDEIREMVGKVRETKKPAVLVLRRGIIQYYKTKGGGRDYPLTMEEAIRVIKNVMGGKVVYVSTTGFISRISFMVEDCHDFYMVGSMGHALPVGLGAALESNKKIVVLDGDGSCLMHAGAMASVGAEKPKNLIHIVLDNETHGSTGGQPSLSPTINFTEIAKGFGYKNNMSVENESELRAVIKKALELDGPTFIHVKINQVAPLDKNVPRVSDKYTCPEIKNRFMEKIRSG